MARIKFEDGTVVNFDGTPTQQDVEEVAQRLNLQTQKARGTLGETFPKRRGFTGELAPTGGAIAGGIAGTILGGPPGGIAGSIAGGALGELVQQGAERIRGEREEISPQQIAKTGAISGGLQAVGGGVVKGFGILASAVRPRLISIFKTFSGFNEEIIKRALIKTPGVTPGLKGGEKELDNIILKSASKLSQFARDSVKEARDGITKLLKEPLSDDNLIAKALNSSAAKFKAARTEIFNRVGDFRTKIVTSLRANHNIGVNKQGDLDFVRLDRPSRIVSGSEQKSIQEAFDLVNSTRNNLSLKHVDSVFERMIVLKSKTPAGTPTGTETKAVIGDIFNQMKQFVKEVYPKRYSDLLESNMQKRILIGEAKEILGTSAHPSPKEVTKISSNILQLFNTGRLPQREFLETFGKGALGEDIVGTSAGTLLKTGGTQISVRAANLTKRSLFDKATEVIPRKALLNFIETGKITGDITKFANGAGLTTKALLLQLSNVVADKTTR